MSLDLAIERLEAAIAMQGTSQQPREGTSDWYMLRAYALGLSFLRSAQDKSVTDPTEFENHFRHAAAVVKLEFIH